MTSRVLGFPGGISRHMVSLSGNSLNNSQALSKDKSELPDISKIDFFDCKRAFGNKSFVELLRGYTVFGLCSFGKLVDNQQKVGQA